LTVYDTPWSLVVLLLGVAAYRKPPPLWPVFLVFHALGAARGVLGPVEGVELTETVTGDVIESVDTGLEEGDLREHDGTGRPACDSGDAFDDRPGPGARPPVRRRRRLRALGSGQHGSDMPSTAEPAGMSETVLDTIDELLAGANDDVDDPEIHYKLRSARQLLVVVQQRYEEFDEAVHDAVDDEEVMQNLRDLGYVE
jgi:hypothetical protein